MYQNRDFEAAEPVLRQVILTSVPAADFAAEAEASTYLCGIRNSQGAADSLQLCAHAVKLASRPGIPPRTLALAAITSAEARGNRGLATDKETVRLAELAVRVSVSNNLPPHQIAQALTKLGDIEQNIGYLDKAQPLFEKALLYYQQDPLALCDQSDVYYGLAGIRRMSGNIPESVPLYKKAFEVYRTCSGPSDRETLRMGAYYAGALAESGRAPEAVALLEDSALSWRSTFEPTSLAWREYRHFLGLSYQEAHRFADAERIAQVNLDFAIKTAKDPSKDRIVGVGHLELARALAGQNKNTDALIHAEQAEQILAPSTISAGAKKVLAQVRALELDLRSKRP